MSKKKGNVSLRIEDTKGGARIASMVYRGPLGKQTIERVVVLADDKETGKEVIRSLVADTLPRLRLPEDIQGLQ